MGHDGDEHILVGRLGMGAFEFGICDYDRDRIVELMDLAASGACTTCSTSCPFDAEVINDIGLENLGSFELTITREYDGRSHVARASQPNHDQ